MARGKYHGLRGKTLNRAIAFIAGMGFWLFGYDQGVMGGLLTLDTFVKTFPEMDSSSDFLTAEEKSHNSTVQGAVIGVYEIGCMMGALTCTFVGDKFGRRKIIFAGSIIIMVGAALQASAFSLAQMAVARVVTGCGTGFITATVPMWQSECAKPEHRGPLVMISGALVTGGIAFSNWVDLGFYFLKDNQANWRFPVAFQCVFAIVILFGVLPLPESPRWLVYHNDEEEAIEVFCALNDIDPDHPYIAEQLLEIKQAISIEKSSSFSKMFDMKSEKKHFHRTCLAVAILILQQLGGINIISYYAAYVYQVSVGLSELNSKIIAAVSQTEYFAAACVPYFIIEKVGRRDLMLWGAVGLAIFLGCLTGTVHEAMTGNTKAGVASVVMIFLYDTCFAIGWSNPPWVYPAEISSTEVRAQATGLATAGNWVFNFMVVMVTPVAISNIGSYAYLIFAAISAVIVVPSVFLFYPETKGRSLEEIDQIFALSNGKTPWDVVKIAKNLPRHHIDIVELEQNLEAGIGMKSMHDIQDSKAAQMPNAAHLESATGGSSSD
ncbi:general substrate transporter [Dipodascopsis uninucleata]